MDLKEEFKLEEDQFRLTGLAVLYNNMLQKLIYITDQNYRDSFWSYFLMFIIFLFGISLSSCYWNDTQLTCRSSF